MNQWSFIKFSECRAPSANGQHPIENFLVAVLLQTPMIMVCWGASCCLRRNSMLCCAVPFRVVLHNRQVVC